MNAIPKTAILHYWLVGMRGGEKVLEALCELYPEADIFTHVVDRNAISPLILKQNIHTTFIARLPFAKTWYKKYILLMPFALEALDLQAYDLILSSEAGPVKGVISRPDALHICYCHSPMRYIWDQYHEYRRSAGFVARVAMSLFAPALRVWDTASATRVDHFVANSNFVAARIRKFYGRDATVIHPPVATASFAISGDIDEYYLCFGQLVFYKRIDLAIEAFNASGKPLVIMGTGDEELRLRRLAGPNITFLGRQSDAEIRTRLSHCRALIFPGAEDFGIVPIEAMASGRPVIAFGAGGALETVIDGQTGILFNPQTAAALNAAIDRFEARQDQFDPITIKTHAEHFESTVFKSKITTLIAQNLCSAA